MKRLIMILAGMAAIASCSPNDLDRPLKEAYAESFMIGCAVNPSHTSGRLEQANELLLTHFNAISPENCLKPEAVQPRPGVWTFEEADEYVQFGEEHDMWMLGHHLLYARPRFAHTHRQGAAPEQFPPVAVCLLANQSVLREPFLTQQVGT